MVFQTIFYIQQVGFRQSKADYSLFLKISGACSTFVLVYVDDIIVNRNDSAKINNVKAFFAQKFYIKVLGTLKYFLSIEVARSSRVIFLCQIKYAVDILEDVGLLDAHPLPFPIE